MEALVVDDRGFAKKGKFSVGVARQYWGTLGRVDNCQVAVSVHLAGESGSACIGMRLYEYLDGRTRDRAARVDRFQRDTGCPLFLISLKAGGLGLNLTAADYVFLHDPWWNPAVEAQAIDRTHRIGQTRLVFAYRLIARDTVEEKVVELQKKKRALADAILSAGAGPLRDLTRQDLELLLS